jgi:ATP-binding cassette subfamily B protein
MLYQNAKLFGIFILILPIITMPLFFLRRVIKQYNIHFEEQSNDIFSIIEESISNFTIVKSCNKTDILIKKVHNLTQRLTLFNQKRQKIRSIFFGIVIFSLLSLVSTITLFGSIDVVMGLMEPGQLIVFMFYAILMTTSFIGILDPMMSFFTQTEEIKKLFALMNNTKIVEFNSSAALISKHCDIKIENLTFGYNNKDKILVDINLYIKAGSFIGITGPSGSGKSSLLKLILNLYPQEYQGDIYIAGINLKDTRADESIKFISYVPQNPMLFSLSIIDNIKFAAPHITEDELNNVIDIACLTDLIARVGSDTILNNKSNQLSGGQKQQVAIARALAAKPYILICDEATSAMDFNLESKILHNIIHYMKGKTILYVAHRIASIKNADTIIVIKKGGIVGAGNHESLMASCDLYNQLNTSLDD